MFARSLLLSAAAFLLAASSAVAADLSGTWTGTLTRQGDDGSHDSSAHLILKQSGMTITGSGGPNESEQHALRNGVVEDGGKILKFEIPTENSVLKFVLKVVKDDTISGDVTMERDSGTQRGTLSITKKAS